MEIKYGVFEVQDSGIALIDCSSDTRSDAEDIAEWYQDQTSDIKYQVFALEIDFNFKHVIGFDADLQGNFCAFNEALNAAFLFPLQIGKTMNRQKLKDENISLRNEITRLESRIAELEQQLQTDKLTGLMERFSFKAKVSDQIESERRSDEYYKGVCLLFADIDDFKRYNETYGHEQGDRAIAQVGQKIADNLRNTDYIGCRIGGDEFAIMLPNSTITEAHAVAHRIRASIAMMPIEHGDEPASYVMISIGVAQVDTTDNIEQLLLKADKRMYEAKKGGKNSVF